MENDSFTETRRQLAKTMYFIIASHKTNFLLRQVALSCDYFVNVINCTAVII